MIFQTTGEPAEVGVRMKMLQNTPSVYNIDNPCYFLTFRR